MAGMTTHQRMTRVFEHREADRIPVTDSPWAATLERWRREGLPEGQDFADYFGLDRFASIGADNSPRYPEEVTEETAEYTVKTTRWGQTQKNWQHAGGVPQFLDCRISTPEAWAEAKKRMTPDRDRVDWEHLKENYPRWRAEGRWIWASLWFGFDITHSFIVGTETLLMALVTDPEWVTDMWSHELAVHLKLFDMVWEAGYEFDGITWCDDMGYKGNQFFSMQMYRELLKPFHKRATDWAHAKGCKVRLHSCGDVRPFVPELVEMGIDMLNPLEVKAGMDPVALKAEYGDRLAFHGGLNAALYPHPEKLWDQMRRTIPIMKAGGGYMASTDHSVPDSVSLEQFREFVELAKKLGSYE